MAKRAQYITYRYNDKVRDAFLFNCRGLNLFDGPGISVGTIIQGKHGFVVTERQVPKVDGKSVAFVPNGKCEWKGKLMRCLYLPGTPKGSNLICMNYIVAEVPNSKVEALLNSSNVPVILSPTGKRLVNLECDRFAKQSIERRAKLVT